MKYCPFCGSGLQDAMNFCPKCGKRFQDAFENIEAVDFLVNDVHTETPKQNGAEVSIAESVSEGASANCEVNEKIAQGKRKSKAPVIASLLCAFIVVGTLVYFMAEKAGKDAVTKAANSVLYLEVYDETDNLVSTGSGFVVEDGTTLVTNFHVIEDAYHIVAWTPDKATSVDVSNILVYDETADLAILKCDTSIGIMPLVWGDSDAVKQGDTIYAVGYPLGVAHTLSDGVVSSRYVDEDGVDTLQITAAISPGSSGGALLNGRGEVVGITCASYTEGQNLNLSIAANTAKELLIEANDSELSMREFYGLRSRVGINAFNLAQDFDLTKSGDFYFYKMRQIIYCYNKGTGITHEIAEGQSINAYKGRLYYYNRDSKKVLSCAFDGTDKKEVALPPEIIAGNVGISDMLVAHGVLCFTAFNTSDFTSDFYICDLDSGTLLNSISDVCNFTFYGDILYIALNGGGIVGLNMKTFETQLFSTSCSPWIRGVSDDGEIYYIDEVSLLENGYYWLDLKTGTEHRNKSISKSSGGGAHWDILVIKNTVYLAGNTAPSAHALYRIEDGSGFQFVNDTLMMHSGGYIPELNYYYVYDGTTVDMSTGKSLGVWVFE